MNALIFVLIALIVALVIFLFCKVAALSSYYDDLMEKVFTQEMELREHTLRFEAHHKDIANNQRAIDDVKGKNISLNDMHDMLDKRLSAAEEKIHVMGKDYIDSGEKPTADDTTAESDAEDESEERLPRQPYPPSVREMAEKFIIAEYENTSIKTIAKLLNIPRATVHRWTKQLIKRGAIQPKRKQE